MNTVAAMQEALSVMDGITSHPLIHSQLGYSHSSTDLEVLEEGRKALDRWDAEPRTREQRVLNEKYLEAGGRAVSLAEMMLRRQGFDDLRSAGDDTFDGDVFNDSMQRVIERAYEKYTEITEHGRN